MATYITLLLDKSGSMNDCKEKTIEAYNSYISGIREQLTLEEIRFSLLQFCTNGVAVVHRAIELRDVPNLNRDTYRPEMGGGTPLIDACVKAINATAEKAPAGSRVQIVIQTDGQENASLQYKNADLFELVKKKTAEGWLFTFLGADMDAFYVAAQMGINPGSTMRYSKGMSGAAFRGVVRNTAVYATTGNVQDAFFTNEERVAAGGAPIDLSDDSQSPVGGSTPITQSEVSIVDDIDI